MTSVVLVRTVTEQGVTRRVVAPNIVREFGPRGPKGDPGSISSLTENSILIGDASNEPSELATTAAGRNLLTAADAAAQRSALSLVPGTDIASLVGGKVPAAQLPTIALTATIEVADQAARLALTPAQAEGRIVVQADNGESYGLVEGGDPSVLADWLQVGDRDITRADITDATAKGRELMAIANDAALQTEIVARIAGTTIAPGQVTTPIAQATNSAGLALRNNTGGVVALLGPGGGLGSTFNGQINGTAFAGSGKISTTSTADDSIETAGGIRSFSSGNSEWLLESGNGFASSINFLTGSGTAGRRWFIRKGIDSETGSNAGSSFQIWARNDTGGAIDIPLSITRAANGLIELRRPVQILGTTPASATAGQTNIGNGTIDTAGRVVARSTAADAIQSLGGYRADAAGAYHFGNPTANDSWRITRSGTDLVIQRRESGSWVTKSTISA